MIAKRIYTLVCSELIKGYYLHCELKVNAWSISLIEINNGRRTPDQKLDMRDGFIRTFPKVLARSSLQLPSCGINGSV